MKKVDGSNPYHNIVLDVIGPNFDPHSHVVEEETPDLKTRKLYEMLHKAYEPL